MRIIIPETYDGFVMLYDYMNMPAQLKAVNVARASYQKSKEVYDDKDKRLLDFCGREGHTSIFRHSYITLQVRCPEVIGRQWWKHIIGSEYTFKDTGWNEVSGRYIRYKDFYQPRQLYRQHTNKKQGASDIEHERSEEFLERWSMMQALTVNLYNDMIDAGVANEQARFILPMGTFTEFYWTASAQALHHFVSLRNKPDAQSLMQDYAQAVNAICSAHYGDVWEALEDNR